MSYKNKLVEVYTNEKELQKLFLGHTSKGDVIYKEGIHTIVFKVNGKCIRNWLKGHGHNKDELGFTSFITPCALMSITDIQGVTEWKRDNDDSVERLIEVHELLEETCNELRYLYNKQFIIYTQTIQDIKEVQRLVLMHIKHKNQGDKQTDIQTVTRWKEDKEDSEDRLYDVYELLEKAYKELEYLYNKYYILETHTAQGVKKIHDHVGNLIEYRDQGNKLM
ncbi:hypothetical protein bcgnr5378_06540 [Bacillus cereus]|uniref:Uncharacterized protein n=1 Tax=Bacillus cereus TaxID=1396 RepID=A0A164L9U8_BACCE|nr:hypothetical protein [Bacillus cereus]KZD55584.1 hypothetical protein B4088_5329 [Bacillus cereus]